MAADLDDVALLDRIQECHRRVATAQAHQITLISELAHRRAGHAITELTGRPARGRQALSMAARAVADELALELTLTRFEAERQTFRAVALCTTAPRTLDHLATGAIDLPKTDAILDVLDTLRNDTVHDDPDTDPDQLARELEEQILKKAPGQNLTALKRAANKALITVDPAAAERRHERKRQRRHIRLTPDTDSMCTLSAYLPADQGVRALAALTALAQAAQTPGDGRTLDQRKADVLVDLITNALRDLDATDIQHTCTHPDHHHARPDSGGGSPEGRTPDPSDDRSDTAGTPPQHDYQPTGQSSCPVDESGHDSNASDPPDGRGPEDEHYTNAGGGNAGRADRAGSLGRTSPPSRPDRDPASSPMPQGGPAEDRPLAPNGAAARNRPPNSNSPSPRSQKQNARSQKPTSMKPGSDANVTLTVSLETLAGLTEEPGHLGGYGPVLASIARDIAATGTWRCALTHPEHGSLEALATSTYSPAYAATQKLRRHLTARDQHCRFPGCHRVATHCDVDHVIPHPDGATCDCNCQSLCPHHHRVKHETRFTVHLSTDPKQPPGTLIWTTPAGREYVDHPEPLHPPTQAATEKPHTGTSEPVPVIHDAPPPF